MKVNPIKQNLSYRSNNLKITNLQSQIFNSGKDSISFKAKESQAEIFERIKSAIAENENGKLEVLISKNKIQKRVQALAKEIKKDYKDEDVYMICVLNGAKPFAQDLTNAMGKTINGTVKIKSFEGTSSTGVLNFKEKNLKNIEFYDNILILEDIIDSGRTMKLLLSKLAEEYPDKTIKICTLLDKPEARVPENKDLKPDYLGFKIKKDFVLGYGLDYYEDGRELDNIYKVVPLGK